MNAREDQIGHDLAPTGDVRILVVEDSEDFRLLLELTLADEGYAVDAVTCAEDGIQLLSVNNYHLVLCDYSLPGHSGVWLLSQVRQRNARQIPFVMVTGDPDAPGIPADAIVIRKPVDFDRFLTEIRSMLPNRDEERVPSASVWQTQNRYDAGVTFANQPSSPATAS